MSNRGPRERSAWTRLALVLLVAFSCFGGAAFALTGTERPRAPVKTHRAIGSASGVFSIRVTPRTQRVAPGATARYEIRIRRPTGRRVKLTILGGRPPGARAAFDPKRRTHKRRATLRITTAGTPSGTYRIRLLAHSGKLRGTRKIKLVVRAREPVAPGAPTPAPPAPSTSPEPSPLPVPADFTIAGDLSRPLEPGISVPLDLELTNPGDVELTISGLGVSVGRISPRERGVVAGCSGTDFSVTPFSGDYGFTLPPASTRSLSELGFPAEQWPQVAMVDRPVDQGGCKGASLLFAYTGTASAP